ncbi:hypothetical protein FDO65_15865 [Nakamurella flava]|uniref:Uncharacterized protein n=1 Tax=Nakamurella flava TaxID=2576308 RepID=A0A4U6QC93_9ACTN|nr:hypothetical protein [Nakamurella flava]TKV57630.1 hypothetical protein FDO65_15865 [Nakamurella flava]
MATGLGDRVVGRRAHGRRLGTRRPPPPWEGDQSIGLEYSFEPHEISDLISELDALTLSGFGAELVVAPVTSVDAKRRLIADVFHEGHLMGLPGTVGL